MSTWEAGKVADPEVDEEGFLIDTDGWNKDVAQILSREEVPSGLNEDHWRIIDYMRKYYLDYGIAPPIRMLTKQTGLDLKYIYQLFPKGPAAGACKVAGLPKPTGCV